MLTKVLRHLRGQYLGAIALFVALGGTSYAALRLPAGSVGNTQIKNHSITPIKFEKDPIAGSVRAYLEINAQGNIVASRPRARILTWRSSGPDMGGLIQWSQPISATCFALATAEGDPNASYVSAQLSTPGPKTDAAVSLLVSSVQAAENGGPGPINVAVICPTP